MGVWRGGGHGGGGGGVGTRPRYLIDIRGGGGPGHVNGWMVEGAAGRCFKFHFSRGLPPGPPPRLPWTPSPPSLLALNHKNQGSGDLFSFGPNFFSTAFGAPLQRDGAINAIPYFRFQDGWSGKKRQEAYSAARKACSTLF